MRPLTPPHLLRTSPDRESPYKWYKATSQLCVVRVGEFVGSTTIPATITIERVVLTSPGPPALADVTVCVVDSSIVFEPESSSGGAETIVNDDVLAVERSNTF